MSKYSNELKMEIVKYVTEKNHSQGEAVRKYGMCKSQIQRWLYLYEHHGAEGLLMKKFTYDGQFKINVIEYMHTNNLSFMETAGKFGIPSHSTVMTWERIYYEEGREALFRDNRGRKRMYNENACKKPKLDKKVKEDLIAENQRLRMENAYLKKLNALVQERIQRENGKK